MLLYALCLEASAYLGVLHPQSEHLNADLQARIKIRLLEQTIARLHDLRMATQEETMAALASLTSYEV